MVAAVVFDTKNGRKRQWKQLWQGGLIAVAAALAVVIPFQIGQSDWLWLINKYTETLSSYNYAVLNTANLMYLLGGNWSALATTSDRTAKILSAFLPVGTGALLLALGLWQLKIRQGLGKIRDRMAALLQ